jgi:Uma2 family endonuclease
VDLWRSQFPAADMDLVVEVVSPESRRRDTTDKPQEYAAAGIPEFWRVEPDRDHPEDGRVHIHVLMDGTHTLRRVMWLSELETGS